jgi:hypothetical protein
MSNHGSSARAWLHGFTAGVAACGFMLFVRRKLRNRRPRLIDEQGTVIPIE